MKNKDYLNNIFSLKDKVIVVTGASGLLGKMHVEAIASQGGIPVIVDINEDGLNEVYSYILSEYSIECFIENVEGFEGDGNLLSKFGLEIRDQGNFVIPAKRWDHVVGMNLASDLGHQSLSKPGEGDLIYMPMTDRIFEIKYVFHIRIYFHCR